MSYEITSIFSLNLLFKGMLIHLCAMKRYLCSQRSRNEWIIYIKSLYSRPWDSCVNEFTSGVLRSQEQIASSSFRAWWQGRTSYCQCSSAEDLAPIYDITCSLFLSCFPCPSGPEEAARENRFSQIRRKVTIQKAAM